MPRQTHKYRLHKSSGRAFVCLGGNRVYLGKYGSESSLKEYGRITAELEATGSVGPRAHRELSAELTINELADRYLTEFVPVHYVKNGNPTSEQGNIKYAVRRLRERCGSLLVSEFGPLAFKALREAFISSLCRIQVNQMMGRIRRLFKWGVENEIVPANVLHGLQAVPGLYRGRSTARESSGVQPVPVVIVEATLPYLPMPMQAMVRLQLLTGCRPAEVCLIRPCDVTMKTDGTWTYRPESHKTEHHGRERRIFLGPKAQEILRPWLENRAPDTYCFSPRESREAFDAKRRANRQTPMTPSQRHRQRRAKPNKQPGEHYTTASYGQAIRDVFAAPDDKRKRRAGPLYRKYESWSPNQLRHTTGTEIRRAFGLEASQTVLGHSRADVTQVYAERDFSKAAEIMRKIG